jgi:hypothetical protein
MGTGKILSSRFAVGGCVTFEEEPDAPYTIQAMNKRFAVLTRPATQQDAECLEWECSIVGEVMYTILDNETWTRGPNNCVFNDYDYKDAEQCQACCDELLNPTDRPWFGISERNRIPVRLLGDSN